jgi:hypothetical protein
MELWELQAMSITGSLLVIESDQSSQEAMQKFVTILISDVFPQGVLVPY